MTQHCSDFSFLHVFLHNTAAISYSVEADGERRKQGLTSRVMFMNKSHSDTDYLFNGTLDLRGQNQETCIKIKAKLRVKHTDHRDKEEIRITGVSLCCWRKILKDIKIQSVVCAEYQTIYYIMFTLPNSQTSYVSVNCMSCRRYIFEIWSYCIQKIQQLHIVQTLKYS